MNLPATARAGLAAAACAALAGCAGIVRTDSRLSVTDDDKHPIPSGVFQGSIVMVNYMSSTPHLVVTNEHGEKLSLIAPLEFTDVELEDIDRVAGKDALDGPDGHVSSYRTILDWEGRFRSDDPAAINPRKMAIYHAAEQGGGHVRGVLGWVPQGERVAGWGQSKGQWFPAHLWIALTHQQAAQFAQDQAAAQARQAALRAQAQAAKQRQEDAWRERVAAWRALESKPPLPEAAHKFRVLAEDAVREKRFSDAVGYYERALAVEPLWPQGQFNAALICGELKRYADAAAHMHRYLELAPDAADAGSAKDKIIVWEEKARDRVP